MCVCLCLNDHVVTLLSQFIVKLMRESSVACSRMNQAIAINLDSANKQCDTHKHLIIELISNYICVGGVK